MKNLKYIFVLFPFLAISCCILTMEKDSKKCDSLFKNASQSQLHDIIKTIARHAFIHHNTFLKKSEDINGGKLMVCYALKYAFDDLLITSLSNQNAQTTHQSYEKLIAQKIIEVDVDGYQGKDQGHITAAFILYLAENSNNLAVSASDLSCHSFFENIISQAYKAFFPGVYWESDIFKEMFARIKPM